MNTLEVNKFVFNALKSINCYLGAYPKNRLPETKRKHFALIINTDNAELPGEHWVALIITNKTGYYFDSYGLKPDKKEIINFIKQKCPKRLIYNDRQIQSFRSTYCGLYAALCVIALCKGMKFQTFIKLFSNKSLENDRLIFKILKTYKKKSVFK